MRVEQADVGLADQDVLARAQTEARLRAAIRRTLVALSHGIHGKGIELFFTHELEDWKSSSAQTKHFQVSTTGSSGSCRRSPRE